MYENIDTPSRLIDLLLAHARITVLHKYLYVRPIWSTLKDLPTLSRIDIYFFMDWTEHELLERSQDGSWDDLFRIRPVQETGVHRAVLNIGDARVGLVQATTHHVGCRWHLGRDRLSIKGLKEVLSDDIARMRRPRWKRSFGSRPRAKKF